MRARDFVNYHSALFLMRHYGFDPGSSPGNGTFRCAYDPVYYRNRRYQDPVDLCIFSSAQIPPFSIYFLSRLLDRHHRYAGSLFLLCTETVYKGTWDKIGEDNV